MENNTKKSENTPKPSFFWDAEKKRPSKYLFILLIAITLLFITWGIADLIASTHEIKIVIDYDGHFEAEIERGGSYEYIEGFGDSEFSYRLGEGVYITIHVDRIDSDSRLMTVSIFDDGELVREQTTTGFSVDIFLDYTVGE